MESCLRKFHCSYGHRVMDKSSKCESLHGHNAVIEVSAASPRGLDRSGMVIDFAVLKEKIGSWIDDHWDHRMIVSAADQKTIELLSEVPDSKAPFVLEGNTTAENLAGYLLRQIAPRVMKDTGVIIYKVVWWETENCSAEQSFDPYGTEAKELYPAAWGQEIHD